MLTGWRQQSQSVFCFLKGPACHVFFSEYGENGVRSGRKLEANNETCLVSKNNRTLTSRQTKDVFRMHNLANVKE